jgi:hypothetical protein
VRQAVKPDLLALVHQAQPCHDIAMFTKRWHAAAWAIIAGFVSYGMIGLWGPVLVTIIAFTSYRISLSLHSDAFCETCGGTGRRPGVIFGWARRQCGRCAGQGRHRRFGAVVIDSGQLWSERRANRAKRRQRRPLT